MQAAATGQIGRIRQLMEQGVDVNDKASDGQTVLMAAAANGQVSTSLSLIVMGANPNEKDNNGLTALMVAASAGHADVIVALFQLESAAEDARALDASPDDAAATFK
jgi:ankyrin repeat protein